MAFRPPAPGTLRTTTGTPRTFDMKAPWSLAAVSMEPPTENPTRMVMGFAGLPLVRGRCRRCRQRQRPGHEHDERTLCPTIHEFA